LAPHRKPAYVVIADDVRSAILNGELAPGTKLPTLEQVAEQYSVSLIVARMAFDVLKVEGLVDSRKGSGFYVRPQRPLRHPRGFRYENTSGQRPMFATDTETTGSQATWEHVTTRELASSSIAARLQVQPGDPLVRVDYRYLADDSPVQLATSWEPLELTRGTPVEQPEDSPVLGVRARMESIGLLVDVVTEDVASRPARPFEIEALEIPPGVHVLELQRTYWCEERPVETADIIIPGDRYTLRYRVPLR
jgi:DNA-binding GntR family transcriptional regulator